LGSLSVRQLGLGRVEFRGGLVAEYLQLVARGRAGLLPQGGNGPSSAIRPRT
jgi:hypothetical protein